MSAKQKMSPEQRVQAMQNARKIKADKDQRERNDHIALLRAGFRKENPNIQEGELEAKIKATTDNEDLEKQINKTFESLKSLIIKQDRMTRKSGSKDVEKIKKALSKLASA